MFSGFDSESLWNSSGGIKTIPLTDTRWISVLMMVNEREV